MFCFQTWRISKKIRFINSDNFKINIPVIPIDKLKFSFCASSGPGGQNVNHVNTKVELRFKPNEADWIPKEILYRFIEQNENRINKDGEMIITSQKERKQNLNLDDCVKKLRSYLEQASYLPKERIKTKVPEYENDNRLDVCDLIICHLIKKTKKHRGKIKKNRSKSWDL